MKVCMENLAQMPVCAINWNAMDQHLILKTQHDLDNVTHGLLIENKNKKQLFDNNDYNYKDELFARIYPNFWL